MKALPLPFAAWAAAAMLLSVPCLVTGQHTGPPDAAPKLIHTRDTSICGGKPVPLHTIPMQSFRWQPSDYLDDPASATPVASPPVTTTYFLTAMIPSTVNLVRNGDFSLGNTGFSSAYAYDNINRGAGEYFIGANPASWNTTSFSSCGDHTSGHGNMMMVNGSMSPARVVWSQRISVLPGKTYALSAWIQSVAPINPAILQFSINGVAVGEAVNSGTIPCIWRLFSTTWNSGSDTMALISVVDNKTDASSNDFALDDISFTLVGPFTDSVTISVYPAPRIRISPDTAVCRGASLPLRLWVSNGGHCQWSPAALLDNASSFTPLAAPAADTLFRVMIIDGNGCTEKDSVNVKVLSNPTVRATRVHDIDCSQPTTQLDAAGAFSYSWSPAAGLSDTTSSHPTVSIDTTTTYIVKGMGSNGCYMYDTVTVNVNAAGPGTFILPNAFTPNGDGHNDCYGIRRWGNVRLEEFAIFNRAGVRIFTTRNPAGCWDGTYNGHPQPEGSYVYVIKAGTFCGPVIRMGNLMLLR